jgi:ring-1,2-phenylacetyl-CoA epoxidase subunit PaaD
VRVEFVLAPAWTTDWISDEGRRKLEEFGIAPPVRRGLDRLDHPGGSSGSVLLTLSLRCPQCGSPDTRELSRFGSTACKSLWVCNACREPFDHFKAI